MKHTVSNHGRIDFLVNNGGGQFMSPLADIRKKGWNAVMDTNLNGTYYCLKHGKMPSVCVCVYVCVCTLFKNCLKTQSNSAKADSCFDFISAIQHKFIGLVSKLAR